MTIFFARYIISLAFGTLMTFVFANINIRKNIKQIFSLFGLLLVIQIIVYMIHGLETVLATYPIHTHLMLSLMLIIIYKNRIYNSIMYVLLAYMSCQIPAWLSKVVALFFTGNQIIEIMSYLLSVVITAVVIMHTDEDSARGLLGDSLLSDLAIGFVPITYYIFDYVTTIWTDLLYSGSYHATQFMPFILCLGYLIFMVTYNRQQKIRRQAIEEKMLLENNMTMVEGEMEGMRELERMARIYRHDMRHQLQMILDFIQAKKYDEAENYILENIKAVKDITPKRYTDIDTVNLLLGRYEKIATQERIACNFDVNISETLPMSNTEICAMVSNVLENACNANMNLAIENRSIDLVFKCHNDMIIFSEDNTCDENLVIDGIDNYIDLSKEHGFGMKSVEAIVNKYNGSISVSASGGHFHIMILIQNKKI